MQSSFLCFNAYLFNINRSSRMLRGTPTTFLKNLNRFAQTTSPSSTVPKPPPLTLLTTEKEHLEASDWVAKFSASDVNLLKTLVELTFSRSSGPGGQNVNKVNTKAMLRCAVNSPWIPRWAMPMIVENPHYVGSAHSILITSTVHRSQAQNIDECLKKLHNLIFKAASSAIVKQTSAEKRKKVEGIVSAAKKRRKSDKIKRSSVKQDRRGKGGWDF